MFWFLFFVLGLCFGYALRLPWGLLAFLVPIGLALAATDRSMGSIIIGFIVTAIGLIAGIALAARGERQHA